MQGANKILVHILLGLIIAVVAGLSAGSARASTINFTAVMYAAQSGTGSPYAIN
jgi:hypothetical protein